MKITNHEGLPEPIVRACEQEENVEGIRVTSLLKGVREYILIQRHWDEIEVDASDMIWVIVGSGVHQWLEQFAEGEDEFKEERLSMKVSNSTLTGKSDLFKNTVLTDYKTTSVYKIKNKEYDDYKKQLMIYALLWKDAGFDVTGGEIVAMMRDHSTPKARRERDYPRHSVKMIRWDFSEAELKEMMDWVTEKVKLIESLENVPDNALPMCSKEERWATDTTWAIKKQGVKKAKKVCHSKAEAERELLNYPGCYIEERPGEDKKCLDYCWAKEFCPYGRRLK